MQMKNSELDTLNKGKVKPGWITNKKTNNQNNQETGNRQQCGANTKDLTKTERNKELKYRGG